VELARTMKAVSKEQNFSLRCESHSGDEIGELVQGFNRMLALIQARDEKLLRHRRICWPRIPRSASVAKSQFLANMSHEIEPP
jgi:signal transduction histidine kinase